MQQDHNINIIIIDDHPLVLQGFRYLLKDLKGLTVTGCFTSAQDSLDFLSGHDADIVLLDINLPDLSGIDLCSEIKKISPFSRIIAISNNNERSMITRMLQNGASGYILKNASTEELMRCITDALSGKLVLSRDVQQVLAQPDLRELKITPRLTRREKEILKLIAAGNTTIEMADQLFISPLTVETHRRNLMQKFEVSNAPALIRIASEHQLL